MDRFLNIDWNPLLEDMIDNTFINEDRLKRESVMHRIITGNFTDPFKHIEEDYKDLKIDSMGDVQHELDEECVDDDIECTEGKKEIRPKQTKKYPCYVPGIVKPIFKFPKRSKLNKEQQEMCLRVLLKFSESDKPKLTQIEREELHKYMELQQIISQEQDEFLEFAKSKWHERSFKLTCEDYINLCWKSKLEYIHRLPRYYTEVTNIPFVANKNIDVRFISTCLQVGHLPKIVLPSFSRPYMLRVNSGQLKKKFPPKNYICNESSVSYKLPVSEDPNCQKLAESNNVDLVISSSGLNCLVNNISPNYSNSWILPLVIKRHNDKNIIYIDKPAPPTANTVPEKNTWVYKYILKYFLIHVKHPPSKSNEGHIDDDIFGDIHSEEILKLDEECETILERVDNESNVNTLGKYKNTEEVSKQGLQIITETHTIKDVTNNCKESSQSSSKCTVPNLIEDFQGVNESCGVSTGDNVSYKLFVIGPKSSEQNELMKDVIKEYKVLVRTKTDGFQVLQNNVQQLLLLAPKLEHQIDLGAEAVTLEESLKQWVSLVFRPDTFLVRVRISAQTSEILQMEHRSPMSINNEIKRLYNVKVEDSLTILHNVIQSLTNLSPGRYVIRHTVRNGAFATVYKQATNTGKNTFDMHTTYDEQFHTLLNSPWISLDKMVPSPMQKCFERMPAMFHPSNIKTFPMKKKSAKRNKANTGTVRRSLRNKK